MKRILDVGCGDRPRKEANFFVDRFPSDPRHRSGREIKKFPKNFVVADATCLPFRAKVFDYCYCHHALEHMERPEEALMEMGRVARAGRIQAPHWFYEIIRRRVNHYWLIFRRREILILLEKDIGERNDSPLFSLFRLDKIGIEEAMRRLDLWETDYRWERGFKFKVINLDGEVKELRFV